MTKHGVTRGIQHTFTMCWCCSHSGLCPCADVGGRAISTCCSTPALGHLLLFNQEHIHPLLLMQPVCWHPSPNPGKQENMGVCCCSLRFGRNPTALKSMKVEKVLLLVRLERLECIIRTWYRLWLLPLLVVHYLLLLLQSSIPVCRPTAGVAVAAAEKMELSRCSAAFAAGGSQCRRCTACWGLSCFCS